jgi:fucose permease
MKRMTDIVHIMILHKRKKKMSTEQQRYPSTLQQNDARIVSIASAKHKEFYMHYIMAYIAVFTLFTGHEGP